MSATRGAPAFDEVRAGETLAALSATTLVPSDKGFAGLDPDASVTPDELVRRDATLSDPAFSTPLMVLRDRALVQNVAALASFAERRGVLLAPHAKTTMSPELFVRQLRAGAWALTAANVTQAAVFAHFGARRILIANELTDPASIRALARLQADLSDLELCCYVDSVAGVRQLDFALTAADSTRPLAVLVELGLPDARAGARSRDEAMTVARAAAATSTLSVVGASCFEGIIGHGTDRATLERVIDFCREVRLLGESIADDGLLGGGFGTETDEPSLILSAGGSHYFDLVADEFALSRLEGTRVVVRSGSYITHDHGTYLHSSPSMRESDLPAFQPAIEIRATVLSRPQPDLVLLNAGRRDVSFDSGMPIPLRAERAAAGFTSLPSVASEAAVTDPASPGSTASAVSVVGAEVTDLNDQHGFMRVAIDSELAVGDVVVLGISHPCTTFDKWRLAVVVDDDDRVLQVAHTFF